MMKTELKAKFIQHLNNRKKEEKGFTLVELLVVIIIIGILAAIALPNFLNQTSKAKQSEGKQIVALVNKTQNSFRAENSTFASTFDILAIGSINGNTTGSTTTYTYLMGGSVDNVTIVGTPRDESLKGYSGADSRYTNAANQSVIGTVICEATTNGTATAPTAPTLNAGTIPTCNAAQKKLSL